MSWPALVLVVAAAFAHAGWNLHAKRGASAGVAFLVVYSILGTVIYAPFALWQMVTVEMSIGGTEAASILGSVALHTGYMLLLQRGYAAGDLSVVYPVARGLGPVLAIAGAMLVLHERPGLQVLLGALVVCAAVASLGIVGRAGSSADGDSSRAFGYAGATGVAIACYTLWDAHAVSALAIPPLLFSWTGSVVRLAVFAPLVWRHRARLWRVWQEHRRDAVVVAVLAPLAYLFVLIAFTLAPVSQVAPLRELSIVVATAFGARLLGEGRPRVRLAIAGAVLVGVVLVVTGR